jgi:hypothetical protein
MANRARWVGAFLRAAALAGGACDALLVGCTRQVHAPQIANIHVNNNPLNVLSAIVTFDAPGADSARAVYSTPGDTDAATPYVSVVGGAGRVVIVGLLPLSTYTITVQASGGHHQASATWGYGTRGLPSPVQAASLVSTGPFSRGLTLVSPLLDSASPNALRRGDRAIAVAFDALGRVRWYRQFDVAGSLALSQQPNGHFTIALPVAGWRKSGLNRDALLTDSGSVVRDVSAVLGGFEHAAVEWAEFLPSGDILHTYTAGAQETTSSQVLLMTGPAASPVLHLFGYTLRPRVGGLSPNRGDAASLDHQIVRQSPPGVIQFTWDAWDHYSVADWVDTTPAHPPIDVDHPNSLDFDLDGNYIASFPNLDAIVKVNAQTGAIIWQLGGRRNQFTIRDDPVGSFSGQYSAHVLPNGHLLIYDNGLRRIPRIPRAVEYALDVPHRVATLVWQYTPEPALSANALGSVQRLTNGNTLVGFGSVGQIEEVDPSGKTIAKATFAYNLRPEFYHATRIASLYQYERP